MGKLILEMQVSIDGFMAGPDGQTDWMLWNWAPQWTWDKALQDFHTKLTLSASHLLISRQMAEEGFIKHWQQTAERCDEQAAFARHINETRKTVISTTLTKKDNIPGGWDMADIAGNLVSVVENLKTPAGNTLVYGGATLASSLLENSLIDELFLIVNPVAIGKGKSVFNNFREPVRFQLKEATAFSSGIIVQHYSLPS
jgi:dihydrofolate reductase